jgi:hypothetical protein
LLYLLLLISISKSSGWSRPRKRAIDLIDDGLIHLKKGEAMAKKASGPKGKATVPSGGAKPKSMAKPPEGGTKMVGGKAKGKKSY